MIVTGIIVFIFIAVILYYIYTKYFPTLLYTEEEITEFNKEKLEQEKIKIEEERRKVFPIQEGTPEFERITASMHKPDIRTQKQRQKDWRKSRRQVDRNDTMAALTAVPEDPNDVDKTEELDKDTKLLKTVKKDEEYYRKQAERGILAPLPTLGMADELEEMRLTKLAGIEGLHSSATHRTAAQKEIDDEFAINRDRRLKNERSPNINIPDSISEE